MDRLKSREKFMPNGFKFRQPETNWPPPGSNPFAGASFTTVVEMVIAHRRGNPAYTKKHNWATDFESVANEVDNYCARICIAHGWNDYVMQGGASVQTPFPVSPPPQTLSQSAKRVVVGASTIAEMFGEEGPVVADLAESRGGVCLGCPKHGKGDLLSFFTIGAAAALRTMLAFFKNLNLKTTHDSELCVCTACYCPMKLKVWAQLRHIMAHMPKEDYDALDPQCWIRSEASAVPQTSPECGGSVPQSNGSTEPNPTSEPTQAPVLADAGSPGPA